MKKDGELTLHNTSGGTLQCVQLACPRTGLPVVEADGLLGSTAIRTGDDSVFLLMRFTEEKKAFKLCLSSFAGPNAEKSELTLESGKTRLEFKANGRIKSLSFDGKEIGGEDFLQSYLTYGGKRYDFSFEKAEGGEITGGKCINVKGSIILPDAVEQGEFSFRFFTSDVAEGIFIITDVR